jgi:hypothetical protein
MGAHAFYVRGARRLENDDIGDQFLGHFRHTQCPRHTDGMRDQDGLAVPRSWKVGTAKLSRRRPRSAMSRARPAVPPPVEGAARFAPEARPEAAGTRP